MANFADYVNPLNPENYPDSYQGRFGGKAFLCDITTGNLLHTFHGYSGPEHDRDNDGFGRSVALDGSYIIISAYGPSFDDEQYQIYDDLVGEANVFSAATYDLFLRRLHARARMAEYRRCLQIQ